MLSGARLGSEVDLEGYQRAWRLRHSADDGLMRQAIRVCQEGGWTIQILISTHVFSLYTYTLYIYIDMCLRLPFVGGFLGTSHLDTNSCLRSNWSSGHGRRKLNLRSKSKGAF